MNLNECKEENCDWYYFCYAVARYCPLTGEGVHGTPKSTNEYKRKMLALGILQSTK